MLAVKAEGRFPTAGHVWVLLKNFILLLDHASRSVVLCINAY